MFAKYSSKKFLASPASIDKRFALAIKHGAIVRLDNKRNGEAVVINSNSKNSLIDFGGNREWFDKSRLWVKVS